MKRFEKCTVPEKAQPGKPLVLSSFANIEKLVPSGIRTHELLPNHALHTLDQIATACQKMKFINSVSSWSLLESGPKLL